MDRLVIVSSITSETFYFQLVWDTRTESSKLWYFEEGERKRGLRKWYSNKFYFVECGMRGVIYYVFGVVELIYELGFLLKHSLTRKMAVY